MVIKYRVVLILMFISLTTFSQSNLEGLISKISTTDKFNEKLKKEIIDFFQKEEEIDFSKSTKIESLYSLLSCIKDKTSVDENFASIIFELKNIVKRNVELSEFLSELVSDIAYEYPEQFIKAYSSLESSEKDKIDSCLFWLIEKEQYDDFKLKILKIKSAESYKEEISRLQKIG